MATVWYGHFDSTADDMRPLLAERWAKYIASLITNGIRNGGECLQIRAGSGLSVNMDVGMANINGYIFISEEDLEGRYVNVAIPQAHAQYPRIDRIVLRLDNRIEKRTITPEVLTGSAAVNPVPPELTRNEDIYELSLARVRIAAGAVSIVQQDITDERFDTGLCGIINSMLGLDPSSWQLQVDMAIAAQVDMWEKAREGQIKDFDELISEIEQWYALVKNDIAKLQTFNFDNLAALYKVERTTIRAGDDITETITNSITKIKVAERKTSKRINGGQREITEVTKVYAENGVDIMKQATITTVVKADNSIVETVTGFDDYSLIAAYTNAKIDGGTF